MINEAKHYLATRNIARREPLYSANRMARYLGDIPADQVVTEHLDELRRRLLNTSLARATIETTISDIITVVTYVTGIAPAAGQRVTVPRPRPKPATIQSIDTMWEHCKPDLRAWIGLTYWAACRQSDGMRWLLEHKQKEIPKAITWEASKTGKLHELPMPKWLPKILDAGRYRFRAVSSFSRKAIRRDIRAACIAACVQVWTPKNLRQASITEWTRANAAAGRIVHGCGLGVMDCYLDPLLVLEAAACRVRLPASFGANHQDDSEAALLHSFRRLDPAAQGLIAGTAERLAAG